ncbi:hypothetical protein GGR20_003659 [Devosia subaequoris]|uniref:Uncharacterized protein n=1 Tax=Devosia subaequoris TaxID=395930 RepID=A0A7W6IQI2_9HYPH|nr:hypothetical protein [Devosia subaequoris]MBB4053987.1 hypothetical protein [Devosia subaequoris]MCP1211538.1 hypothetical protein [Devosia subaequoris]
MRLPGAIIKLMLASTVALASSPVDLSNSYAPLMTLTSGYYACRSGLDFDNFTHSFDLAADGRYSLRGTEGQGKMILSNIDGVIEFQSGPFLSDGTVKIYGRNTTRISDGKPVIVIRYDFGTQVTDDYCAIVE